MAKIIEANLEMKLKSAITGLQAAHNEYRNALYDYHRWTGFDDKGNFFTLNGHESRWKRLRYCQEALAQQKFIVDGIKAMMEGDEGWNV